MSQLRWIQDKINIYIYIHPCSPLHPYHPQIKAPLSQIKLKRFKNLSPHPAISQGGVTITNIFCINLWWLCVAIMTSMCHHCDTSRCRYFLVTKYDVFHVRRNCDGCWGVAPAATQQQLRRNNCDVCRNCDGVCRRMYSIAVTIVQLCVAIATPVRRKCRRLYRVFVAISHLRVSIATDSRRNCDVCVGNRKKKNCWLAMLYMLYMRCNSIVHDLVYKSTMIAIHYVG